MLTHVPYFLRSNSCRCRHCRYFEDDGSVGAEAHTVLMAIPFASIIITIALLTHLVEMKNTYSQWSEQ